MIPHSNCHAILWSYWNQAWQESLNIHPWQTALIHTLKWKNCRIVGDTINLKSYQGFNCFFVLIFYSVPLIVQNRPVFLCFQNHGWLMIDKEPSVVRQIRKCLPFSLLEEPWNTIVFVFLLLLLFVFFLRHSFTGHSNSNILLQDV